MSGTSQLTPGGVDTGKVLGRRTLRFETIEQALSEVDRLAAAERAGRLKRLGNWTLGQTFGHLATWIDYSFTGSPLKVPLVLRLILGLRKRKFLYEPMRAGVKIPGVEGGTLAREPRPLDEAETHLRRALERLRTEAPQAANPIFGALTHDEWIAITLRHAEMHLGFMVPE